MFSWFGLNYVCVKDLMLNEVEMVFICDGESAKRKVCGIYQSPAPKGLKILDRLAGIQT